MRPDGPAVTLGVREGLFRQEVLLSAAGAAQFIVLETTSSHFIYTVIKLLLILIKLKNLFVNEEPEALRPNC